MARNQQLVANGKQQAMNGKQQAKVNNAWQAIRTTNDRQQVTDNGQQTMKDMVYNEQQAIDDEQPVWHVADNR